MDRAQAREDALKRAIRRRKGRSMQEPKSGMIPRMSMEDKLKMEQRRRLMMKRRDSLPGGMLTGGQAKIAAKAPPTNKIDAKDFAVLRAEKAKGRGKGLQDEKMKPGKIMKADKGKMIKKDPTAPIKNVGVKDRYGMPIKKGAQLGARAAEAAKATRMGKIAAGVAAAALLGKAALEKMYEKRTGKKPFTKREKRRTLVDKKMGGGMMMRPNPVGYKTGKMIKARGCKLGRNKPTKMY